MTQKRIKISRIENQMNDIGVRIDIVQSLVDILIESMFFSDNLKHKDTQNRTIVLQEKILNMKKEFSCIVKILRI